MIRSERNMAIIVIENDKNLLLNIYGANIATARIGVKFGGCGINLLKRIDRKQITIKLLIFLLLNINYHNTYKKLYFNF